MRARACVGARAAVGFVCVMCVGVAAAPYGGPTLGTVPPQYPPTKNVAANYTSYGEANMAPSNNFSTQVLYCV